MPLKSVLKDLLACPKCKGALAFPEPGTEIHCEACKLAFRVDDGIPVMLLEEARPLPPSKR